MKPIMQETAPGYLTSANTVSDRSNSGDWKKKSMVYSLRFLGLMLRKVSLNLFVDTRYVLADRTQDKPIRELLGSDSAVHGAYVSSLPFQDTPPKQVAFQDGVIHYAPYTFSHYLLRIQGSFDEYLGSFSSKTRSTLRRKVRKLEAETGEKVDWREYQSVDEMEDFYRQASLISKTTYQERLLDAGLPQTDRFRRELADRAESGCVCGYLLFIKDQAVAYMYCPIDHDNVMAYSHVGYNQEFSKLSPGTVLMLKVIEHLFEEGKIRIFDFEEGDGAHKAMFSSERLTSASVYYFKLGFKTIAVVAFDQVLIKLSSGIKYLLKRFSVDAKFKTILRQRFRS